MGDTMLFYFVGIKGSALSAFAKILSEKGHIVRSGYRRGVLYYEL